MRSEKGQAIVFLALGLVTFLGFVALAIDGGLVFADRRHAQNGSDSSSLSGAGAAALSLANNSLNQPEVTYSGWDCTSYYVKEAEWLGQNSAIARGASNGFTIDPLSLDTDNTYVKTGCRNWWNGSYYDRWLDVTVNISDSIETSFAHLLFPEPLGSVVSATARVRPSEPLGLGNAIIALRDECKAMDGGVRFRGSSDVHIIGGSIFSNACFEAGGGPSNTVIVEPDPDDGGEINNVCIPVDGKPCYDKNGIPTVNPEPIIGSQRIPPSDYEIPPPSCGPYKGSVKVSNGENPQPIDPGTYDSITVLGGTLRLNPGLYCITDSSGVTINGGNVYGPLDYDDPTNPQYPWLTGVSFYLTQGGFNTAGGATSRLTAAMQGACDPVTCPYINDHGNDMIAVLIYLAPGNTSEVSLLGTSQSDFTGLVYAPNGTVELGGTSNELSTFNLQIIADTVFVHGTTELFINFDRDLQRLISARIELAK